MHNALTDILNVDSYAENLTKEYEMRKEEIIKKKNKELQSIDENLESFAGKMRSDFNRELEEYEKNNSQIIEDYRKKGIQMKENYSEQKAVLLNFLADKLLDSDHNGQL